MGGERPGMLRWPRSGRRRSRGLPEVASAFGACSLLCSACGLSLLPLVTGLSGLAVPPLHGSGDAADRQPEEEVLSVKPLIVAVRNWATLEECRKVLDLISRCHSGDAPDCQEIHSRLHASGNKSDVGGRPRRNSTSFQLALHGEMDEAVDSLVRRAHILARHPITYGEGVQVASYHEGDYYEFHHDSLQRRATLLLYLTDIPKGGGGETIFPMVKAPGVAEDAPAPLPPAVHGRLRSGLDFKIERMEPMAPYCESDYYLKVRPEAGKAILFFSYRPDYAMDEYAVHGACQIVHGHKAILQRWMRFEENSLFTKEAKTDEAVRRGRAEWGKERLLKPSFHVEPAEPASTPPQLEPQKQAPEAHSPGPQPLPEVAVEAHAQADAAAAEAATTAAAELEAKMRHEM